MTKMNIVAMLLASTIGAQVRAEAVANPAPAAAAPAPTPSKPVAAATTEPVGVGEIIVTAQRRSERINDVPLAISALGRDELKQQGIVDTADLSRVIPSFTVQTSIFDIPVYFLRGVGFSDLTANTTPTVSVYIDETPLPYSVMARGALLDVERVEVLKGPQGTLYGENSTGGAVNYIAAKPTPQFHYGADLSYGRFNDIIGNAFVSGPISNTLSFRVAAQAEHSDDWQYSTTRNDTRGKKRFVNGRLLLSWKPSPGARFDFSAQAWQDKSDTQSPQFLYPTPQNPFGNPVPIALVAASVPAPDNDRAADWDPGSEKARNDKFFQFALRGTIDLSPTTHLTSITAYSGLNLYHPVDLDGLAARIIFLRETTRIRNFSQELRLDGKVGRARWMIGGSYEHNRNTDVAAVELTTSNNQLFGFEWNKTTQINNNPRIRTLAAFGSLDYKITDTLTARGSVRYTSVHDDHSGCLADADGQLAGAFAVFSSIFSGSPTSIVPGECVTLNTAYKPTGLVAASLNQHNVSWRAGLDWKLSARTLLYANVAKGFKAGSFTNVPAVSIPQLAPVSQESVLAYEAGLKTSLIGNRAHLDLSAFYYDYRDKQLSGYVNIFPFGPLPTLVSVPKSEAYGVEGQLTALITPLLRAQVAGTWVVTRVKSNPSIPISPIGTPTSYIGESFPNSPKYQVNFDLEQRIPLSGTLEAYVGGNVGYRSESSAAFGRDAGPLERRLFRLPSYTLVDARAGLRFNGGNDSVDVWVRNLTDRFYLNSVSTTDATVRFTGKPRTYGVRVSHRM